MARDSIPLPLHVRGSLAASKHEFDVNLMLPLFQRPARMPQGSPSAVNLRTTSTLPTSYDTAYNAPGLSLACRRHIEYEHFARDGYPCLLCNQCNHRIVGAGLAPARDVMHWLH